eukprot:CAMPEP_0179188360 /NCGR_PEP_ID=MMETSP0796-20121207/93484_1 /TAXON_ID=73915 /ORGANISM="Pyrodinium bahamense, Strain pbaha01" /LENGTH=41 /DNA_ID= /DNA_START= /DNA_END= /DNA_ORIENTATION=
MTLPRFMFSLNPHSRKQRRTSSSLIARSPSALAASKISEAS